MLDKAKIEAIHKDIRKALEEVSKKHNLSIAKTRITYATDSFRFNAEFGDKSSLGETNPIYFNDLKKHGWRFGIDAARLNDEFEWRGVKYKLQGMKGKERAVGNSPDGKTYLFPADVVAQLMGCKRPKELQYLDMLGRP